MKVLKTVFTIIVDLLIVLVLAASSVVIIANTVNSKDKCPNFMGYTISSVLSDSMEPTFYDGDLVVGKIPESISDIKENDIISFSQEENGELITNTHRVVDIYEENGFTLFRTQGDNRKLCTEPDEHDKTFSDVKSVYKTRIRYMGSVIQFLKKPLGFVLCLVLPILLLIIYEAYKLIIILSEKKKAEYIESAKDGTSEELKEAIIQEYLNKQKQDTENKQND